MAGRLWSASEDAILRETYSEGGVSEAALALPDRHPESILRRASTLRIPAPVRVNAAAINAELNRLFAQWGEPDRGVALRWDVGVCA